jgi:hypothetical protein
MPHNEEALIGTWSGTHLLNTPVQITFDSDYTVRFNGDVGVWRTVVEPTGLSTLYMTFKNSLLLSNQYIIYGDTLIIITNRDNLILKKIDQPHVHVPVDLVSLVQTHQAQQTNSGLKQLQPNKHVIDCGSWNANAMPKIYQNDLWGVHFCLPPTWFYAITDYLPVILSCLEPGMILGRFYRPASEDALNRCYTSGYGERNVWFNPSFPSIRDISDRVFPIDGKNCKRVYDGEYYEKLGTLKARLVCLFSVFGDCFVFFGISSTDEKKFNDLAKVMDIIVRSVTFERPKSLLAPEALCGTYVDRSNCEVFSLTKDNRFEWKCKGKTDAKYGTGAWEILGSDLEGELKLHYDNGDFRKVMYLVTSGNKLTLDHSTVFECINAKLNGNLPTPVKLSSSLSLSSSKADAPVLVE